MKKKISKSFLALFLCLIMCVATSTQCLAAGTPYTNIKTTGTGSYTGWINTSNYSNQSIGHFSVETQGYSSSSYITVTIYYGNNAVASYFLSGNTKVENIGINQNFYYPAGTYKIVVGVSGSSQSGWTGVWLYH